MLNDWCNRGVFRKDFLRSTCCFPSLILFLFAALNLSACDRSSASNLPSISVDLQSPAGEIVHSYRLEVADTPSSRTIGLMYRKSLPKDRGMLFVFPKSEKRSFWMKNTYISLDIIFLDSNHRIVSIAQNTIPLSTEHVYSAKPAKYVVELVAGETKRRGIKPGWKMVAEKEIPEGQ